MASDDSNPDKKLPPQGRFSRFRKLAGLSATVGADMVRNGARRLTGQDPEFLSLGAAEKLVATLGDMKGAAMKMGQALSMDSSLLTPELRGVLSKLQNQAPAMDYGSVCEVIEEELGGRPESLYATFDEKPLASASLGQVHAATLADGSRVVVKVQYPGVDASLQQDFANLNLLVKTMSMTSKSLDGRRYFEEMRGEMLLELDYDREARLAQAFEKSVAPFPELKVPGVISNRSARRVLTLERLEGVVLKDWLAAEHDNAERYRVACLMIQATYAPFFFSGDIHADPHPGNYVVMNDGRLGILDYGAIKHFDSNFVESNRRMFERCLKDEPVDVLQMLREQQFTVALPDAEAEKLLEEMVAIATRPLRTPRYAYADCTIGVELRNHFTLNAPRYLKVPPPPETLLFFRAAGGLVQNLRSIEAEGDFQTPFAAAARRR